MYTVIEPAPGHLVAGTLGDGVWSRPGADHGWHRCDGLPHPLAFDLLRSPSTGDVFVATGNLVEGSKSGGIYRSTDGERWEPAVLEPNTVYDLVETSSGTILAGAQRSRVLRSDDGGRSFVTTRPTRPRGVEDVLPQPSARATGCTSGAGNELLRSDDAADTWQVVGRGLDGVTVYGVAACDDGTLLAATSSGVYRSTDAGAHVESRALERLTGRSAGGRGAPPGDPSRPPSGAAILVAEPLVGEPEREHEGRRRGDEREHEHSGRATRHRAAHRLLELIGEGVDPARRLEQRAQWLVVAERSRRPEL